MRMRNPAQMKGLVKNVAAGLGVPANVALHMYVMERFIDRISRSEYRDRFVLKGGFLLYSIKGMDRRTTEDLDMTSKTMDVIEGELTPVIKRICETDAEDDFVMEMAKVDTVAELLEHPGSVTSSMPRTESKSASTSTSFRRQESFRRKSITTSSRCSVMIP